MCTVSFIPVADKILLTSSRDEKIGRKPALPPQIYPGTQGSMLFPKDGEAGGSWIALSTNGNAGVLLNGAFEKHQQKPFYAKSRGLIFLHILDSGNPQQTFMEAPLRGIEPFTLIIWQQHALYECRWDEQETRHCGNLPASRSHLWSSCTLYDADTRRRRAAWLEQWLQANPQPTQSELLRFHRFAGESNGEDNSLMNRSEKTTTVSISSLELRKHWGSLQYFDYTSGETHQYRIPLTHSLLSV